MVKKVGPITITINVALYIVGVLVSLAVGFGMVDGTLSVRWIPEVITIAAGWVVVILTLVCVLLSILKLAE